MLLIHSVLDLIVWFIDLLKMPLVLFRLSAAVYYLPQMSLRPSHATLSLQDIMYIVVAYRGQAKQKLEEIQDSMKKTHKNSEREIVERTNCTVSSTSKCVRCATCTIASVLEHVVDCHQNDLNLDKEWNV